MRSRLARPMRLMVGLTAALLLGVALHSAPGARSKPASAMIAVAALEPLQPLIDAAADGAIVTPKGGRYAGPVVITRPVTIDGSNGVTIDGRGRGTVIHVKGNGVTLRTLRVVNSGDQHNDIDAGIRLEGDFNVVKDSVVEDCLFGIDLQKANGNVVRRNRITSKGDLELGVKGDAIRIWYGSDNSIDENDIDGSRDLVDWYGAGNTISRNQVRNGRYGLHFMYSKRNLVEDNIFAGNLVGISMMYSDDIKVRRNRVFRSLGAAGTGIGFKESSNGEVTGNEVLYNAVGLAFDISPFEPGSTMLVYGNRIAFNDIGISFLSDRAGSFFKDNVFQSNTQHVAMRLFERAASARWQRNYWDDYEGFDRDHDGIGDQPYVMRSYADRLWMDVPAAAFFKGSPALSTLDFIERLAPFTEPLMLLQDPQPRMRRDFTAMAPADDKELAAARRLISDREAAESGSEPPSQAVHSPPEHGGRLDPFGLYKK